MSISFNNIPDTIRTPGAYAEVDNSRALQGLAQNPHKVLILGQKLSTGSAAFDQLIAITQNDMGDGFFGAGSVLARMCSKFKDNNPNTELYAMCIGSGIAGAAAGGSIIFSEMLDGDVCSGTGTIYMMINGKEFNHAYVSDETPAQLALHFKSMINSDDNGPLQADVTGASLYLSAKQSGTLGNYINVRFNYYEGQSVPPTFSGVGVVSAMYSHYVSMNGGSVDPDLGDAWAVIENEQFQYIIQPYIDAANLTEIEDELATRFTALEDQQGHGYTAVRGTQASCTTLGNSRNAPHNTIIGANDSPMCPEEWAAAVGAIAAAKLNIDPARPLQFLQLKGILPPPTENRFTRSERDILLYDGISTFIVDGGKVKIERLITTYQTNALGILDPSYLDVTTLATLGEIRDQYKIRMSNRFIIPRYKLADDGFPVQPGSYVATPSVVAQEIIALFSQLRDVGLIENFDEFVENLVVQRNLSDRNRVDVLLPPDLINQFRVLATLIQFIL
jgi:phage tail sheath gpL-like